MTPMFAKKEETKTTDATPGKPDNAEIRSMRLIAHRVVDQLTAVSGYSQIAMERRAAKLGVCHELEKIRVSADKAVAMVKLALVHLAQLEEMNL